MWTEEQFIELEQEERKLTDEAIAIMLLIMLTTKGNIEKELRNFYQKYGKDGVVTYHEARKWVSDQDHRRRLTALNLYLSGEFLSTLGKLTTEFEKMLKTVISKETVFFNVEIEIDAILNMKWGEDFSSWLKRLEDDVDLWISRIGIDLKRAMLQQKSIDELLDILDGRFNSIDAIIKKLGLTESTATGSLARQKIFQELGITKYQFYTKVDERRCETCGAMHGLIFPISAYEVGSTASPLHPHCRCWEVPILE